MIRQLGNHVGKHVIFGFDRYLLPELEDYLRVLARYGSVLPDVDVENLHYLTSAQRVCARLQGKPDHVGILVCGTGMGMSIAANKFRGIYAARCVSAEDATLARTINNTNVLCLASTTGLTLNEQIIDTFMCVPFEGRKLEQLEAIAQLELEARPALQPPALEITRILRQSA